MNKILSVKPVKKHEYKVELMQGDALYLHQDTVLKHSLLQKPNLDAKTLKKIKTDDTYHRAMQKALDQLAKQELSKKGLKDSLKTYSTTVTNQVVESLEAHGYLDEEKALKRYINEMIEYGDKGPKYILDKLLRDGYEEALVLSELSAYEEAIEKDKIAHLIDKQLRQSQEMTQKKWREKLSRYLYNKGFNPDYFMPLIEAKLASTKADEAALLEKRLLRLKSQYPLNDYKEKQKLIKKLLNEGFAYDLIKSKLS